MIKSYLNNMSEGRFLSFDKKNLSALIIVGFVSVLFIGGAVSQSAQGYEVEIGQNGIKMYSGTLDVQGNDIESSGTTIWDASQGVVPESVVEGVDLSGAAGNLLTWDNTNSEFDVEEGSINHDSISGVSSSDHHTKTTDTNANTECSGSNTFLAGDGGCETDDYEADTNTQLDDESPTSTVDMSSEDLDMGSGQIQFSKSTTSPLIHNTGSVSQIAADGSIELFTDYSGSEYRCVMTSTDGNWNCDGTKSWVHDLENGSEAVYTSQESPEVRAVYEGQVEFEGGKINVSLPSHFEKTVSDSAPKLRVQATPHSLNDVAVTSRSDSWIFIESDTSEKVEADYRVTGIREGYEDRQVVREKEE